MLTIFWVFLRLGCTSFGGPVAHLGYFRTEFVERRAWLRDEAFSELVALAQVLPGPGSSQVGFAVGLLRGGWAGGLAAFLGFTLPSALLMLGLALSADALHGPVAGAVVHGLQLVAVAVVAQAVLAMQRSLAPDRAGLAIALGAMALVLFAPAALGTLLAVGFGAAAGLVLAQAELPIPAEVPSGKVSKRLGIAAGLLFAGFLVTALVFGSGGVVSAGPVFSACYRTGALVFGGGHVVLPLLAEATVARGWVSPQGFLAGYGAVQAMPGPLFSFAAYLGAVLRPSAHPVLLGLVALAGVFLPGLLLMAAVMPFWGALRGRRLVRTGLRGVNASVVGLLLAALYRPVWTSTVRTALDFSVAAMAIALLVVWRLPPWALVLSMGAAFGLAALMHLI